jgi:hypothetical protein
MPSGRRHECDGDVRSNDQDATALSRCEELAGSAPKVVTPMRSMATDRVLVFGPTSEVAKYPFQKSTSDRAMGTEQLIKTA